MNKLSGLELRQFVAHVIAVLERSDIPYMVVGGFAAIAYGEPRNTLDVDIVVQMREDQIRPFIAGFPEPQYYVSEDSIRDSLTRRYPFNVIDSRTAAKADLVPMPGDPFTRAAFGRRERMVYDAEEHTATFISAEDLVVGKLLAYKATESQKHLRDAQGVIAMQAESLNMEAIRHTLLSAGAIELLEMVVETLRRELGEDDVSGSV